MSGQPPAGRRDRGALARALDFALVSLVAAALGAGATGASEAVVDSSSVLEAVAATGFVLLLGGPLAFILVSIGRLVWRGWRPAELAADLIVATGGAPRLAAWALFLAMAATALAFLTLQAMVFVTARSTSPIVHALAAPIAAVGFATGLAALSRPALDRLLRLTTALDLRLHRRFGRSLMTPRAIASGALALAALLVAVAWFTTLRPSIGHYDLSFLPSLGLGLGLLAAAPSLCARVPRRVGAAVILIPAAAALVTAIWVRQNRLFTMIGIWGESQISGLTIDTMFDLEALRGQLHLEEIRPPPRPGAAPRDILLVTIDTVRADRTPPYGGTAHMPALTRLAGQGAVFQWAFSPGNVTRRSLPSMMLGLSPARVRGRVAGWALRLDPRHVLVAERLRAAGYDTAGFFCCTSQFGAEHELGLTRGIAHVVIERRAERLASMAASWLAARSTPSGRPVFVWLHFIEPHEWQSYPPGPAGRRRLGMYEAALADADRALGLVLDAAWSPVRRQRTYVMLSSDHGEALGDHGHRTHSTSLYNAEIRVPLLIAGPGIQPRRIDRPVGLTDLAPTILDLAGFAPPAMPRMDGVSLGPLLRGEPVSGDGEAYSAMIPDRSVPTGERALVLGRHKIIRRGDSSKIEIYDLTSDPDERRNLTGRLPDVERRLAERLARRRAADQVSPFD